MVNITGLRKAAVLAALYNAARPQGMGFLHYDPKPMTEEEAKEILDKTVHFDYLKGRVMKVSLDLDEVDERLYDRDNGMGVAAAVVDSLRTLGDVNNSMVSSIHKRGTHLSAREAEKMADTKSSSKKTGTDEVTFTLGADELGPSLKDAVKKATREK